MPHSQEHCCKSQGQGILCTGYGYIEVCCDAYFQLYVFSFTRGFSLLGKYSSSQKQCAVPRAQCTEEALEKLAIFCSPFEVEIQMYHPFEHFISACYYFYLANSLAWPHRWQMFRDMDVVTSDHYSEDSFARCGTLCLFFSYNIIAIALVIANVLEPGH